jgi:tetratricopeptide (TPR) repeat protein
LINLSSIFPRLFPVRTMLTATMLAACGVFLISSTSAALQQLQVGMPAPDFSLRMISGETRTFADVRGEKKTVILFWSTWDRNSEQVLARMQKLYEKYSGRGLAVIAVNANKQNISESDMAQIRSTVGRLKLTFPVFVDSGLSCFHDFGIIALPTTVIVDSDHTITYELPGYPLVGSEEMADFIVASIEGKAQVSATKSGYQPNKTSLRFFNMGRNTLKSGAMADTAEFWFKKSAEADSKFMLPHINLGKLYLQRGDKVLAEAQFKEVLAKDPASVIALCETALIMIDDGRIKEGTALLESAFKADGSYTPCYYYSGLAYGRQGMLDQAMRMFDEAEKHTKSDQNLFIFKGRVLEEHNKQREATEAFRKALETILQIQ